MNEKCSVALGSPYPAHANPPNQRFARTNFDRRVIRRRRVAEGHHLHTKCSHFAIRATKQRRRHRRRGTSSGKEGLCQARGRTAGGCGGAKLLSDLVGGAGEKQVGAEGVHGRAVDLADVGFFHRLPQDALKVEATASHPSVATHRRYSRRISTAEAPSIKRRYSQHSQMSPSI